MVAAFGCGARKQQAQVAACVEQARVIDARPSVEGGLATDFVAPLLRECDWVHAGCSAAWLVDSSSVRGNTPAKLIDQCEVPSCPLGSRGSPACADHWRAALSLDRPLADVEAAVLAYYRSAIDDELARARIDLDAADRDAIARAWGRWWWTLYAAHYIRVSPPKTK